MLQQHVVRDEFNFMQICRIATCKMVVTCATNATTVFNDQLSGRFSPSAVIYLASVAAFSKGLRET